MDERKPPLFLHLAIGLSLLLVSGAVAYYFIYYLPSVQQQRLDIEKQTQAAEDKKNQEAKDQTERATASAIEADCVHSAQDVSYLFGANNAQANPLYYPYEDIDSVNKNDRLVTALDAYISCLQSDPRNDQNNATIKDAIFGARMAWSTINQFNQDTIAKYPYWCDGYLISQSTKQTYCTATN